MADVAHRILLVEDNPDLARIMTLLLRSLGHRAQAAASGREALAALGTLRPDLALVDLGLPDVDGYTLAPLLRSQAPGPLVLAAVTGRDEPEDRERSRAAGFDHHLTKPLGREDLQALLDTLPHPDTTGG